MASVKLVIVTGMSGAGRTTALRALEDLGYFCVDNIPPALIPRLLELLGDNPELARVGLGIDVRTGSFLAGADATLDWLSSTGHVTEVIFLESNDEQLVRRFSETRRSHPLAPGGNLLEAIQHERERLAPLRARATLLLDTSGLSVHDLRRNLTGTMAPGQDRPHMIARIVSFGFKYGLPVDADLVFDLRYLPNPHFVPELRPKDGRDEAVADFVLGASETRELLDDLERMLTQMLPRYEREGKAYLTIALGCTGGLHRSVCVAEELASRLGGLREIVVEHRELSGGRRE